MRTTMAMQTVPSQAAPTSLRPEVGASLSIQALWQEQVHSSRVTALALSADGGVLYSGCDAAAPKLSGPAEEPPLAAVSTQGGQRVQLGKGLLPARPRLLTLLPEGRGLLCVGGDGSLATLSPEDCSLQQEAVLPGTPAAQPKQEEAAGGDPPAADALGIAVQHAECGPDDFVAESGYRGAREGYLFREGSLGRGYYRKAVVRSLCPAPAADTSATGSGGHAPAAAATSEEEARAYIQRLLTATPSMASAAVSGDGRLLFTPSLGPGDTCTRVWRLGGQQLQPVLHRTLTGHTAPVLCLALSPDGALLFTGGYDQAIRVWSTADWHCQRELRGHGSGVRAMAVSPDGATLYSAAADNTVRAWSTRHWVCLRTLHGRHQRATWPCCMALSPDGGLLATGSTGPFGGSTLKLFQTQSSQGREAGTCLATFAQLGEEARGDVSALAFSPDGTTLFSGASDGSMAAWRLSWQQDGRRRGLRCGFL